MEIKRDPVEDTEEYKANVPVLMDLNDITLLGTNLELLADKINEFWK